LYLRETTGVKSWTDAEKWIRKKVTRIFENISGRVITGPFHGKHQTDFIEAVRKNVIKALKALWLQQRLDRDYLKLDASKEKPKFQNILKICKKGVTLLSHQLVIATEEPLQSYDPTLTIAAQAVHEFFNHLLEENRALVIADENFRRDGEAFLLPDQAEREELKRFQQDHTQVVHSQFLILTLSSPDLARIDFFFIFLFEAEICIGKSVNSHNCSLIIRRRKGRSPLEARASFRTLKHSCNNVHTRIQLCKNTGLYSCTKMQ
jgi:hypothetical protein